MHLRPKMRAPRPSRNPERSRARAIIQPPALIVAGPTCSGKSALALALAQRLNGVVINADAMQLYRELRVLTARPSPADEACAPHALYGVVPAAQAASVAWWRAVALAQMSQARPRLPILCGGTGLYLHALIHGLAEIPDPGAAARDEARALLASLGPETLHARLREVDPATAARLRPSDKQRIARAWEVWRGTGQGLAAWQGRAAAAPPPWRIGAIVLKPERSRLRAAIAARWTGMIAGGAIAEAVALGDQGLDESLPAMRAHGVRELLAYRRGEIDLAEAGLRTLRATSQYSKRQATWLKHHKLADPGLTYTIDASWPRDAQDSQTRLAAMSDFLTFLVDAKPAPP